MSGLMGFLEKAGLARRVDGEVALGEQAGDGRAAESDASGATPPTVAVALVPPVEQTSGMSLEQVYAAAGVPPCPYPAERLQRLLDGLKAMEPALRLTTIQAIDAADDSWSIEDPVRDAAAKAEAIETHAATIRAGVTASEQEATALLSEIGQRRDSSVEKIKGQIAELEGLLAREMERADRDCAAVQAGMQAKRDAALRELGNLTRVAGEMRALVSQFNVNTQQ
jgi:hypothetical protein